MTKNEVLVARFNYRKSTQIGVTYREVEVTSIGRNIQGRQALCGYEMTGAMQYKQFLLDGCECLVIGNEIKQTSRPTAKLKVIADKLREAADLLEKGDV